MDGEMPEDIQVLPKKPTARDCGDRVLQNERSTVLGLPQNRRVADGRNAIDGEEALNLDAGDGGAFKALPRIHEVKDQTTTFHLCQDGWHVFRRVELQKAKEHHTAQVKLKLRIKNNE